MVEQTDLNSSQNLINSNKSNQINKFKYWKILFLPLIFIIASIYMYYLSSSFAYLDKLSPNATISLPRNLEQLRELSSVLLLYKDHHFLLVFVFFCSAYVYKQTFAIPGSALLNLLAGALFGVWIGFPLVCVLTAIGASNCYWLSHFFGMDFIVSKFPTRIATMQNKMNENKQSQFFFLLFLRLFPMSPNWFLNMVAPILKVKPVMFFVTVLFGLMPYNYICVETGGMLATLNSMNDVISLKSGLKLLSIALVAILPSILLKYTKRTRKQD